MAKCKYKIFSKDKKLDFSKMTSELKKILPKNFQIEDNKGVFIITIEGNDKTEQELDKLFLVLDTFLIRK